MIFLQLGTYKFEALKTPQGWSDTETSNYEKISVIGSKPVLQYTGEDLVEISFDILLAAPICDPEVELKALRALKASATVLPLIDGRGVNHGNYVITSLENDIVLALDNGRPSQISLTMKLLEYNSNVAMTAANTGEALSENSPVAEDAISPVSTPAMQIGEQIKSGNASVALLQNRVSASPTDGAFAHISALATTAATYYNTADNKIKETKKIVYRALELRNAIAGITSALTRIKNAADIKNISDLLNANSEIDSALYEIRFGYAHIAAFITSREGGE